MVAILTPLGVVGYFRWAWKQLFHVEPPAFAEAMVGALVVLALLVIAVDEFRKRRGGRPRTFNLRRIFMFSFAGGVLLSALIVAVELAGPGVNGHRSAIAAAHASTSYSGVSLHRRARRPKRSVTATQTPVEAASADADAVITQGITVAGHLTLPTGTMLYRVAELKYPYNRMVFDRPTTWFVLGAETCSQRPGTGCSTPIAVPDVYWKATSHGKPSLTAGESRAH
ncbi:MAG TPA: hypothetical protein VGG63_05545 [Steroidobacteraceae bacterium]|jgi:hypothetical protein